MKDYRQKTNYLIDYQCIDSRGMVLKSGKIKAKNKASEFEALVGTETYLKSKVHGMVKMVCVKIEIDYDLGNAMDFFNNLFKYK